MSSNPDHGPPASPHPDIPGEVQPGTVVGGCLLEEEIGHGGLGTVYRGTLIATGDAIAVKVLTVHSAPDRTTIERFHRGCELAATLSHPNIVRVLSYGMHGGRPFLAMNLIDGQPLDVLLNMRKRYPPDEAQEICLTIARALAYLHSWGFIHRDIKPSNIIRSRSGQLYLTDFDLLRHASTTRDARLTGTGTVLGTPAYMSPEQICGQPMDERSDLYSLGAVWYELLTGRPPFGSGALVDMAARVLRSTPKPLDELVEEMNSEQARVIMRLLAQDPARRPDSMEALISLFTHEPLAATPVTIPEITAPKRRRQAPTPKGPDKVMVGTVVGIALAALLMIVLVLSGGDRNPSTRPDSSQAKPERSQAAALEQAVWLRALTLRVTQTLSDSDPLTALEAVHSAQANQKPSSDEQQLLSDLRDQAVEGIKEQVFSLIDQASWSEADKLASALVELDPSLAELSATLLEAIREATNQSEPSAIEALLSDIPQICLELNLHEAREQLLEAPLVSDRGREVKSLLTAMVDLVDQEAAVLGISRQGAAPPPMEEALSRAGISLLTDPGLGLGPLAKGTMARPTGSQQANAGLSHASPSEQQLRDAVSLALLFQRYDLLALILEVANKLDVELEAELDNLAAGRRRGAQLRMKLAQAAADLLTGGPARSQAVDDLTLGEWQMEPLGQAGETRLAALQAAANVLIAWHRVKQGTAIQQALSRIQAHLKALWVVEQSELAAYGVNHLLLTSAWSGRPGNFDPAVQNSSQKLKQINIGLSRNATGMAPGTFTSKLAQSIQDAETYMQSVKELRRETLRLGTSNPPRLDRTRVRNAQRAFHGLVIAPGASDDHSPFAQRSSRLSSALKRQASALLHLEAGDHDKATAVYQELGSRANIQNPLKWELDALKRLLAKLSPDGQGRSEGGETDSPNPEPAPAKKVEVIRLQRGSDLKGVKGLRVNKTWSWGSSGLSHHMGRTSAFLKEYFAIRRRDQRVRKVQLSLDGRISPPQIKSVLCITTGGVTWFLGQDKSLLYLGAPDEKRFSSATAQITRGPELALRGPPKAGWGTGMVSMTLSFEDMAPADDGSERLRATGLLKVGKKEALVFRLDVPAKAFDKLGSRIELRLMDGHAIPELTIELEDADARR